MKIDVSTKKHPNIFAEIDDEDAARVLPFRWAATKRKNAFYVRGIVDGRDLLLHRYLMDVPDGLCIDHRDSNPLNNRRSNLRVCTQAENTRFAVENGRYDHLKKADGGGIHTIKRRLATGEVREYRYRRRTRERICNEMVNQSRKPA